MDRSNLTVQVLIIDLQTAVVTLFDLFNQKVLSLYFHVGIIKVAITGHLCKAAGKALDYPCVAGAFSRNVLFEFHRPCRKLDGIVNVLIIQNIDLRAVGLCQQRHVGKIDLSYNAVIDDFNIVRLDDRLEYADRSAEGNGCSCIRLQLNRFFGVGKVDDFHFVEADACRAIGIRSAYNNVLFNDNIAV